jgi:hypothetical protein
MGTEYLIDTNVIIGYLDNKIPTAGMEFISSVVDETPAISIISKIELLRFDTTEEILKVLTDFVNHSDVYPLNDAVAYKTISISRGKKIKLPDAIIAATCITYDLTLLTRNTGDFKGIAHLKILNPWEMTDTG